MNIHNHLIPTQIHNTTPIKQGDVTPAQLKEKLSESKAVVVIRGQEFVAEFTNEIPQSEKVMLKVLNISDNKIQVEAKGIAPHNNNIPSIDNTEIINKNSNEDPMLSIVKKKGLQPGAVFNSPIKEALSGNMDKLLDQLNREILTSIREVLRVSTNSIKSELNPDSLIKQVNQILNKLSPFINAKIEEDINSLIKEVNVHTPQYKLKIVKNRLIQSFQQIEADINTTKERAVDINKSENHFKYFVHQNKKQIQHSPSIWNAIEKTQELLNSLPLASKTVEELKKAIQETKQYQQLGQEQLGKERIVQALQKLTSEAQVVEVASKNILQTEKNVVLHINNSEIELARATRTENQTVITKQVVDQWINMIQKQSKMGQALNLLKSEIDMYPKSPPVKNLTESIERAIQQVEGKKELAARKEIHETLQQIKSNLPSESLENPETQRIHKEMQSFLENSPLFASESKNIVVAKVTEKLAKAAIDFKEVQRELIRNLNNVEHMSRNQHTQHQAKQLLESTIAKLDNSILKSEMMILSDMGTEKKLLQASSQLAEAKKLLSRGNSQEVQKIVQSVSKLLEKINWQPSEVKVMHYTHELTDDHKVPHYEKQLTKTILNIANYSEMEYGSPRDMYEKLRSMGLNYERDIGNYFASNKPEHQLKDLETHNLKYLLQKISSEEGTGKLSQQIEQTLSNITGQQLLSKSDHQSNQQSMMFSLPVQLEQEMKNIKVFVNSKKDGQKVDWENCSLYFLIETPKLGEVGIHVSAADRKLSLTIKNNSYNFEQVAKPIGEKTIHKMEEIGYHVNGMKFTDFRKESAQQDDRKEETKQAEITDYFTEKGMNFTI